VRGFEMTGKVYLVGAGPGKQDLITVRGANILRQADTVIYDYLVDNQILENVSKDTELICCEKLGKKRYLDGNSESQDRINKLLIKKARQGRRVVRLKNGDASIFSRISQELEALSKENIEFEIVPGITAASAVACLSGIPLTDRRFSASCVFVTGHENPLKQKNFIDWSALGKNDTIVLYMAVENLGDIIRELLKAGKHENTPVAIAQDASMLTQKVLTGTLKDITGKAKRERMRPPAIIIIGEVVSFEKQFNWLRKNKRILFTGLSGERFFLKGTYFHLPLIRIEPLENYRELDSCIRNIKIFDWVVFSSRFGVEYFFKRFKELRLDARVLNNIKIAAIGNCTSERLLDFTISADLVPKKESSKGLIDEFRSLNIKGKKIFLPRSDISDKGLEKGFEKLGAIVTSSFAYRNVMTDNLPDLDLNFFNEIMFTSPSGIRSFVTRYGKAPERVKITCIGDTTKKEAFKCGLLG
jgi:uroporphyrinogen III methyltransferase/synthase